MIAATFAVFCLLVLGESLIFSPGTVKYLASAVAGTLVGATLYVVIEFFYLMTPSSDIFFGVALAASALLCFLSHQWVRS